MKLLLVLILFTSLLLGCQRHAPLPPQELKFNHDAPEISVPAFGGTLLGFNRGEWGGKLAFRDESGKVSDVVPENVLAIFSSGDSFVVFTGLAHLGTNEGHIYLAKPDEERRFKIFSLHKLDGAPENIVRNSATETVSFAVLSGMDDRRTQPGAWIYACKVMQPDYQIKAVTDCRGSQP